MPDTFRKSRKNPEKRPVIKLFHMDLKLLKKYDSGTRMTG
jgi:hypothetical protein